MAKPTVAYWDFRGLAEPIRYLLHYVGVDFDDKRYTSKPVWLQEKFNLGLDFPNLPYYIDGDIKITQSVAILRHLARKHNLAGQDVAQKIRVAVVEQQLADFRMNFFRFCMNKDFEKDKPEFLKNLKVPLKQFSEFLGDRKFLAGDDVTYVDFIAYDSFDFYKYVDPAYLDEFPNLKSYYKRLRSLPQLQTYMNSSTYKTWPLLNPAAPFGGSGPEPNH